jgi:hypothetical protein
MFIKELYQLLENSWNLAIASDLRFPTTVVSSNTTGPARQKFEKIISDTLLCRAQQDPKLYLKLLEVAHLIKPVNSLSRDIYVLKTFLSLLITGQL